MKDLQGQETAKKRSHTERFFNNVLWNWAVVGLNIATGLVLTPYIIRTLGDARYGIWALALSMMDYVFLFDLGFRSAVVNFVARFRAQGEVHRINEVIITSMVYLAVSGSIIALFALVLPRYVVQVFHISADYRDTFAVILTIIGLTWAFSVIAGLFQASLEAHQQFGATNRIIGIVMVLRSIGCALVLYLGYGLLAMAVTLASTQMLAYLLTYVAFRKAIPSFRFSSKYFNPAQGKAMLRYGGNSITASGASVLLSQGPPVLIGHGLPEAFVGYYVIPWRLTQYLMEVIARMGYVTVPRAAELFAVGSLDKIAQMGVYLNRYSIALFLPAAIFLSVFSRELLARWIGPTYSLHSAPLLAIFAFAVTFAIAGQFNSSQLLFGMAQHGRYSRTLIVEAVIVTVGIAVVPPHAGIFGVACVVCGFGIVNRGLITPFLLCKLLGYPYLRYMLSIYTKPVLSGIPVLLLALAMQMWWLRGDSWAELLAAAAIITAVSLPLCYFTCVDPEHREMLLRVADRPFKGLKAKFASVPD